MKMTHRGFTLIELLVVVLIIGILSAIALPQYTVAVEKSRATEAITNIATIKQQMQLYIMENGLPSGDTLIPYTDFSNVELSGGSWDSDMYYISKNFSYYLFVSKRGAYIEVKPNKDYDTYSFLVTTYPQADYNDDAPVGNWYHSCVTQETDIGRKICKQYEGQGWKYADTAL